jgi:glycine/D-amino acid oxidase-like deaminating enzyme
VTADPGGLRPIVGDLGRAGHVSWVVTAYMRAETVPAVLAGKSGNLLFTDGGLATRAPAGRCGRGAGPRESRPRSVASWLSAGNNDLVDADVVVIGAGALGLSTALHCALAGRSVTVVERLTAGSQASGRAAGLFKSVQADELRTRLARRSITLAATFAGWAGEPLAVSSAGSFLIARTPEHRDYLRQELAQARGWGADVREAEPGQLGAVSYYRPNGADFALWCPEDVYIEEPLSLVAASVAAGRRCGAEVAENEPVTGILVSGGRVAGVETGRRTITAPVVVDAAGGWVRPVGALAGARVPVATVRHQLLITSPDSGVDPGDPIVRVVDAAVYLRPARGGLMVGGFEADPLPVAVEREAASFSTDDVPLDLGVLRKLADQVAAEAPVAGDALVDEHRGGLFTMSPDGRFVAGPVPGLSGLWVASGCNGSGFSSSLAIGEALAAWITSGSAPEGIAELAPGRFGPLGDEELVSRGIWQYAHYYDPAPA